MKKLFYVIAISFYAANLPSQTKEPKQIDRDLTAALKKTLNAELKMSEKILAPRFKKDLLQYLSDTASLKNPFDSLSKYMHIKSPASTNIRFFGWQTHGIGVYFESYAQFKTNKGKLKLQQMFEQNFYKNCLVYEVNELSIDSVRHYLTFGWTKNGSYINIIQLYKIAGDSLVKCKTCFDGKDDIEIQYPRGYKTILSFNSQTKDIEVEVKYENSEFPDSKRTQIKKIRFLNGRYEAFVTNK